MTIIEIVAIIEVGIGPERDHSQETIAVTELEVQGNSRSRSGSRASTNSNRIRCYNCGEYDHFVRDCPTSREERDIDQLQQMLNLEEEEQTHLLNNVQSNPVENSRTSPVNL